MCYKLIKGIVTLIKQIPFSVLSVSFLLDISLSCLIAHCKKKVHMKQLSKETLGVICCATLAVLLE